MGVFELKAAVLPNEAENLEDLLAEFGDPRLMVLEDKPSGQAWLTGYFDSAPEANTVWHRLIETALAGWKLAAPVVQELPDADWKDSYKAHFKASKFGRLNWVPVWEREGYQLTEGEEVLWLDPGMAFGTGNHETTRLCCERLADFAERRGCAGSVIDAGCGSGILALSAVKLGFRRVSAFDNDSEAVRVSEQNAELNGLAGVVVFRVADLVIGLAGQRALLVLANIQADVLIRSARILCAAVAPEGELVLSGILSREIDEVRASFAGYATGWQMDSRELGEWSDLSLRR